MSIHRDLRHHRMGKVGKPSRVIPEDKAQNCVQMVLGYLQRDKFHNLRAIGSHAWSLHCKDVLPQIQVELPVHEFLLGVSCPTAQHHREEPHPSS